jgi:hypothetical protein
MTRRLLVLALVAGAVAQSNCAAGFLGFGGSRLRPTNVEVRILSQSGFQGEVEPCG